MYSHGGYKFKVRASKKRNRFGQQLWDLIVITPKKKEMTFFGVLDYSNGWDLSKTSERCEDGSSYYLSTIPTGFSPAIGFGISSRRSPELSETHLDILVSIFNGTHSRDSIRSEWHQYTE